MKPVNAYLGYSPSRVSRVKEIDSSIQSWESVLFQQGKSVMDFDLNVLQNILRNSIGDLAKNIFDGSGFFKNPTYSVDGTNGQLTMPSSCDVNIYGRTVKVQKRPGMTNLQKGSAWSVKPSGASNTSGNFFWIEFWYEEITPVTVTNEPINSSVSTPKTYIVDAYGGVDNRNTASNAYNNILDPIYGTETARRIQLRWRLRSDTIVNRTLNNLGFGPDGLNPSNPTVGGNAEVLPMGGNTAVVSNFPFYRSSDYVASTANDYAPSMRNSLGEFNSPKDQYLYIAGRGTADDAKILNTVDGRVYGIPICMAYVMDNTWLTTDLLHVVGISTGSVIAGGSASIGTHVHMFINEGYSGLDANGYLKLWDRITFTAQQDVDLGRPAYPADIYLTPYDSVTNYGYVIPKRMLIETNGTVALPSLSFYSQNSAKNKKTGFSYLEASNTDSLIVSVGATNIGQFFSDSTGAKTTRLRQWDNSAVAENGLVVSGSTETTIDAFVGRRLVVGYDEDPGLSGGTGLKIKKTGNVVQVYNGGSGYNIGDVVLLRAAATGVTQITGTVTKLISGRKRINGTITIAYSSSTANVVTFSCNSDSDVSGISTNDNISFIAAAGINVSGPRVQSVNTDNSFVISGVTSLNPQTSGFPVTITVSNVTIDIDISITTRYGCVAALTLSSSSLPDAIYDNIALEPSTRFKMSRIKKLRTSYIDAETAILKNGIINGGILQTDGVDIVGKINANARLEFMINSNVLQSTSSSVKNAFPKARSINFIKGPLINLSGQMDDTTDIYSLTISGALDAFIPWYATLAPKYYFIAGRLYDTLPSGTSPVAGLPADRKLGSSPLSVPEFDANATNRFIKITVGVNTVGIDNAPIPDKVATIANVSSLWTLEELAAQMQAAVAGQGTLNPSNVSVSGAEIKYSSNTGFSFDTKSAAVWKTFEEGAGIAGLLTKLGIERKVLIPNLATASTDKAFVNSGASYLTFETSGQFALLAPRMIITDNLDIASSYRIATSIAHMNDSLVNHVAAQVKPTVVEGQLVGEVLIDSTQLGSGYMVGDILDVLDATGSGGQIKVTKVKLATQTVLSTRPPAYTSATSQLGSLYEATVIAPGSGYSSRTALSTGLLTRRVNYIEITSTSEAKAYINYPLSTVTGSVTSIPLIFSSSITKIGDENKSFINSGDRYLSPSLVQRIRNDQTGKTNSMTMASLPSDVWVEGRATIAARRDHRHEREGYRETNSELLPSYQSANTAGTALTVSRGDHTHGWPQSIPTGVTFGSPPVVTDGNGAIGTATEFFGLTGPAGKQLTALLETDTTGLLRTNEPLKSALVIWDTDKYGGNLPQYNSEFYGYVSAIDGSSPGNLLTITTANDITIFNSPGVIITYGNSTNFVTTESLTQESSPSVRKYVKLAYYTSDQSNQTAVLLNANDGYGSAGSPVKFTARVGGLPSDVLPDVGGRIAFGGKVRSDSEDYAVFGAIRGGKLNNNAGDRNGYISLEARFGSTGPEPQTRYMKEFLRGYNTGHVIIGNIKYGTLIAKNSDLTLQANLSRSQGGTSGKSRLFRVTGRSLFEDGILMNKGDAEFTNIETSNSSPSNMNVYVWSTNSSVSPILHLQQKTVVSPDSIDAPFINQATGVNSWKTYLTSSTSATGPGHYTIALNASAGANIESIGLQVQRDTISTSDNGLLTKIVMYPSAQIGSTLNNNSVYERSLTFETNKYQDSSSAPMSWKISSNNVGDARISNFAKRSFSISATPLVLINGVMSSMIGSTFDTDEGKPGQPQKISPNFQTFVLTDFSNTALLYNKRVDFDANVTVNGMELSPTATTTAASFLNTTPQNIFEVYQGTTGKPWRLGTYNKLANLSGNFTASTIGQNNTVLSLTGGTTYNGVYGFLAGQKFTIGLNTYTIQSVDYVAKTITLTESTSLSGPVFVTVEDVSGGLKGQFDRIANEYRLGFITRDNSLWNTGSIEFNDLHFRTGSGSSLKSKMYIANNGNVGISDNYFTATAAPLSLLHIHDSGTTSIEPSAAFGTLTFSHAQSTGQSSIVFKSAATEDSTKDYGYIKYQSNVGSQVERSRLTIGVGSESRISSESATIQRKADDVFINASGSIVGQGSGVAGLFAPRVSIPAQSFSLPTGTIALEVPLNQARALGVPDAYGITPVRWNRYELIYSDTGTSPQGATAVSQWADATISLPWNYTPGAQITARVIWYGDNPNGVIGTAKTGNVQWELLIAVITPWVSDAESGTVSAAHSASKAPFSIGTVTSPVKWSTDVGAIFTETKFTWTPDSPSGILLARPGDLLGIRLQRNAGASTDNFAGNAFVSNLILEFGNALGSYFTD